MRSRKKNEILTKEVTISSKTFMLALFLLTSVFFTGLPTGNADSISLPPKVIWGYVTYKTGDAAIGVPVIVSASGYSDETYTTDNSSAYQVDVGPDTGTEWPKGTPFTIKATINGWKGSNTGTVEGTLTRCDVTLVKAKSIGYSMFNLYFERPFQSFLFLEKILNKYYIN